MHKLTTVALLVLFVLALVTWSLPAGKIPVCDSPSHCWLEVWSVGKYLFCSGWQADVYLAAFPFIVPLVLSLGRFRRISIAASFFALVLSIFAVYLGSLWEFRVSFSLQMFGGAPPGELWLAAYLYVGILMAIGLVFFARGLMLLREQ